MLIFLTNFCYCNSNSIVIEKSNMWSKIVQINVCTERAKKRLNDYHMEAIREGRMETYYKSIQNMIDKASKTSVSSPTYVWIMKNNFYCWDLIDQVKYIPNIDKIAHYSFGCISKRLIFCVKWERSKTL